MSLKALSTVLPPHAPPATANAAGRTSFGPPQAESASARPSSSAQGRNESLRAEPATAKPKLTPEQEAQIRALQRRDAEVRAHEQAHASVGGRYAGMPKYDTVRGPDDRIYAVGGEVEIDLTPVTGDPAATIDKMEVVKRAALAPMEPSAQDRRVAQKADQLRIEAQRDLHRQDAEERRAATEGAMPAGLMRQVADLYERAAQTILPALNGKTLITA